MGDDTDFDGGATGTADPSDDTSDWGDSTDSGSYDDSSVDDSYSDDTSYDGQDDSSWSDDTGDSSSDGSDNGSPDGSSDDSVMGIADPGTVTPGTYTDADGTVHMAPETITANGPDANPDQDYPDLEPTEHTVQSGDTLAQIASQYGVDLPTLIHNNPQIQNPDRIFPGQSVHVPQRKDPRQEIRETFRNFQQ